MRLIGAWTFSRIGTVVLAYMFCKLAVFQPEHKLLEISDEEPSSTNTFICVF